MADYSLFSYKKGSSLLHKCPAWCKIVFIPVINILLIFLPMPFTYALIGIQLIIAFCLHFSIKEQFADLKLVFIYGLFLFFIQFMTWLFNFRTDFTGYFSWENQKTNINMLVWIFCVLQTASLMFKTSTSLELREGIAKIFGQKSALTNALFMFLNFIPMVGKIWEQSKRAWFARGGKHNIKMYMTLLPVLFSVGLKKAYNAARAVSIRS